MTMTLFRSLLALLLLLCTPLGARADEPFVIREQPPLYPGGVEQLREELSRQTAVELMQRAERKLRRLRREALPEAHVPSMGMMEIDAATLHKELSGWLIRPELPRSVVLALTISERGEVAEARVLQTPAADLAEAACAAAKRLQVWMPGRRLTDEGWRAAPFRYIIGVRVTAVQEELAELLKERAARENEPKKSEQDGKAAEDGR